MKQFSQLTSLIFILSLSIGSLSTYIYYKGAFYQNKIFCIHNNPFCAITTFDYDFSPYPHFMNSLLNISQYAKRVDITNWKYGRTVTTSMMPLSAIYFYNTFSSRVEELIGEKVYTTPLTLPTSVCLLVYDQKGDFINWHFDVNYFNGRFFTVLIPVTLKESCTKFKYKDSLSNDIELDLGKSRKSVIFEGENLFHMATPLCSNDTARIVLSLQYTTDPQINSFNRFLMNIKDLAYVPVF